MSAPSSTTEDTLPILPEVDLTNESVGKASEEFLAAQTRAMSLETAGTKQQKPVESKTNDKHLNEKGGEDLSSILLEEKTSVSHLEMMREKHGLDHEETLEACIRVLESWILLYKLKPMDDLITEILPICKARGGTIYVKCLQMKAFMRFKQFRYREALDLFYEFKDLVGPSAELLENMGHTHNTLGEHDNAIKCFREAFTILQLRLKVLQDQYEEEQKKKGLPIIQADIDTASHSIHMQTGGLLMGLGTSLKRLGKYEESQKNLLQALALYKKRFNGQDHSLIAKTLTGLADLYTQMGKLPEAYQAHQEAVRIFKITCGVSPLTANALVDLGQSSAALAAIAKQSIETKKASDLTTATQQEYLFTVLAVKSFDEAFELHCGFDTLALPQIITLATLILDNKPKLIGKPFPNPNSPKLTLQSAFNVYRLPILTCLKTIHAESMTEHDDSAVFYKSAGELLLLGGYISDSVQLLTKAKGLFEKITSIDCSSLVKTCAQLIETAHSLGKQNKDNS